MLNTKSFLAVDFGAGSVKLAEFEVNEAGGLRLKQFGIKPLGAEGAQEGKREAVLLKALQELLAEKAIKARNVNVCAPGFQVFSKFVKLPPVESGKVTQMIQYEAQQNVPFPLEEVVWDYQILGTTPGNELEVLLVAVKSELVEGLFRVTAEAGLRLQLADASAAALCNAFRYNYGEMEDCTMLLDIGAKTSNLLFFEKGKVFSRSINIGANSITQDFVNESKLPFAEAERFKVSEGFVSLGGAYEEPESPRQAAISKVARQFMTRLHIQVNQTLQFYRGQQGGSSPQHLFLAGGASIMTYTAQFFAEKLNVPVEYFNPFRNVQIDPAVNLEELSRVAHALGEVVGLGLRNLAHCPVELNLMPASTRRWQSFNEKKPYFIATVFSLTLVVFATGYLFEKLAKIKLKQLELAQQGEKEKGEPGIQFLQAKEAQFNKVMGERKKLQQNTDQVTTWLEDRYYWADVLTELRRVLIQAEDTTKQKLKADTGIWIERFVTSPLGAGATAPSGLAPGATRGFPWEERRGGEMGPGARPLGEALTPGARDEPTPPDRSVVPEDAPAPTGEAGAATAPPAPTEISTITMLCRAVSRTSVDASANTGIAFAFLNELKTSPLTDPEPKGTDFVGNINPDEPPGTFTFGVTWKLKRPIKL